jgi:signal transduction histidine kinase
MILRPSFVLSYRTKLLLALLIVNIPLFITLSVNEIIAVRNFEFHRELSAINAYGQFLASEVTETLEEHDTVRLAKVLSFAVSQSRITVASILDTGNTIMFSTSDSLIGKKNPSPGKGPAAKIKGPFLVESFPVHGKPIRGMKPKDLQITYSLAKAYEDIRSTIVWEIFIDAIEILIILLVAWFISGLLLKPLVEIRDVSDKMAMGDFSNRVHAHSRDVIGQLAAAVNNMASRLHLLTNTMQDEIDRATKTLTERNEELDKKRRQLEESNRKLRELDVLKSDFVSMVSHELRTPLTSIIGFAKTIRTLPLPEAQRTQYLDIIESEGKRLSGLVEEYLDISKIESGNFSVQKALCDLDNLIRSVTGPFSVSHRKNIRLELPTPGSLPVINADAGMIKRVLFNFIDNAIKYSDGQGEIIVSAIVKEDGVVVSVQDFGRGIDPDDADKIFHKFYQGGDQSGTRKGGSGLGLAIAKGIVDAHNGKIWFDSRVGKGTTFSMFLPLSP